MDSLPKTLCDRAPSMTNCPTDIVLPSSHVLLKVDWVEEVPDYWTGCDAGLRRLVGNSPRATLA